MCSFVVVMVGYKFIDLYATKLEFDTAVILYRNIRNIRLVRELDIGLYGYIDIRADNSFGEAATTPYAAIY